MVPKVVFVLGAPGAGKGTQCRRIVENYGFKHLSAGDLLRQERANAGSKFGDMIDDHLKNGKIVPVEITCALLERAMNSSKSQNFLIDGFPRNEDNLNGWTHKMAGKVDLVFVLFFDCSLDICAERCLGRGAAGSGRIDDNLETLQKRFRTYENETKPIIKYYERHNLVHRIDSTKCSNDVFARVREIFDTIKY